MRAVLSPFCSPECDATGCDIEKPFFAEGCLVCDEGGAAPVGGVCPEPAGGPYNEPATELSGNGDISTVNNI
jgi:hypothetical protein